MMTLSINTGSLMLDTLSSDALKDVFADTGRRLRGRYSGIGCGTGGGSGTEQRSELLAGGGGLSAAEDAQRRCGMQLVVTKLQTVANFVSVVPAGAPFNW